MRKFHDDRGNEWLADVREEATPRHHGRFVLVLRPAEGGDVELPVPEVRWQTAASAARTLETMAEFELRRRLLAGMRRMGGRADAGKAL